MAPPDQIDAEQAAEVRDRRDDLAEALDALTETISERHPRLRTLLRPKPLGTGDVQALLRPGEAIDEAALCAFFGISRTPLREALKVLDAVERHGDREAYRRARELKTWLSRPSSARSAAS